MNIAFAGFRHSHIYGLYYSALENPNIDIIGCYEEDYEARVEAENKIGKKFEFDNYEEILNNPKIDIIAIGDYYAKRGQLVINALKHGKHVICDKPICTDISELEEIEKLSKENNLVVTCMLDLRYISQTKAAKEIIESGEIGEIKNVSFTGQHFLNYGSRPSWYFEKGKHGGTINDIAIHGVDLLRYLIGKDFTKIEFAKEWNAFAVKEPSFKDSAQFIAKMDDITVNADVSYSAPEYNKLPTFWRFEFWGSKGLMTFCFNSEEIHIYNDNEKIIKCGNSDSEFLKDLALEINGKTTILNSEDILKSQRQVLEIQLKAEECQDA